jgi:flagellar biosynthesis regulator FlaF
VEEGGKGKSRWEKVKRSRVEYRLDRKIALMEAAKKKKQGRQTRIPIAV